MDLTKKRIALLLTMAAAIIALMVFGPFWRTGDRASVSSSDYITENGRAFGTFYSVKYLSPNGKSLRDAYTKAIADVDASLSTFNDTSIITRVNRGDSTVRSNELFCSVMKEAYSISVLTGGAFDVTVAPLVNAFGFGFDPNRATPDSVIAELRSHVGYDKVRVNSDMSISKSDPKVMLDASAIAKGFGVDQVAQALESNGVNNYLVEIGGEIVCRGVNPKGNAWTIGVNKPVEDSLHLSSDLQCTLTLHDNAVATSGNYLQFYYKDGKKYSHTIDPRKGRPVNHTLLSTTVLAPHCSTADALATACMVLGLDSAMSMISSLPNVEAYFIYSGDNGEFLTKYTENFPIKQQSK